MGSQELIAELKVPKNNKRIDKKDKNIIIRATILEKGNSQLNIEIKFYAWI